MTSPSLDSSPGSTQFFNALRRSKSTQQQQQQQQKCTDKRDTWLTLREAMERIVDQIPISEKSQSVEVSATDINPHAAGKKKTV